MTRSPANSGRTEPLDADETRALGVVQRFGIVGALLLAFGSLGAGAAPVLNPVLEIPVLRLFTRIPTVSVAIAYTGMGMMVIAGCGWAGSPAGRDRIATQGQVLRTLLPWVCR